MIDYVPFLKLKSNEIMALKELDNDLLSEITPFFDYAKRPDITEENFISTADKMARSLKKNAGNLGAFYLDNYDIDSDFEVLGSCNYAYLLSLFVGLPVIPVVSIDRSEQHIMAVYEAKESGIISTDVVAFRVTPEDFQEYDLISEDIVDELDGVFNLFSNIDLVLDSRVCLTHNVDDMSGKICSFIQKFIHDYNVRKIIITGSTIPASISGIIGVESDTEIIRVEVEIFQRVISEIGKEFSLTFGDYGTVSPNYSDIDIPATSMRRVTAPKIIYSYDNHHYIIRGGALHTHPLAERQYEGMCSTVLSKSYYRGEDYSFGDRYLDEKSRGEGNNATPSTMVKPLVNSHITYMCKDFDHAKTSS